MINTLKNRIVEGKHGRNFLLDLYFKEDGRAKPLIVFGHGFKGFKDWGHWEAIGIELAKSGIAFIKFNYAFNGTTLDAPSDFDDLEAFGQNNYTKELDDFQSALDWLFHQNAEWTKELDRSNITVIGHSRGGPIALITANEDQRVSKVVTWAAVHGLDYAWPNDQFLEQWKLDGVFHVKNGRTGQMMPLYYQLYENYLANEDRLDLSRSLTGFNKPTLIIHGAADPAVPVMAADVLQKILPHAKKVVIETGDHVFNGRHPFTETELPPESQALIDRTRNFVLETA
ncbi:MAG: alpha/beta fold hydrolase [Bacteroidota bacterium]